jgi:hypothetical protein
MHPLVSVEYWVVSEQTAAARGARPPDRDIAISQPAFSVRELQVIESKSNKAFTFVGWPSWRSWFPLAGRPADVARALKWAKPRGAPATVGNPTAARKTWRFPVSQHMAAIDTASSRRESPNLTANERFPPGRAARAFTIRTGETVLRTAVPRPGMAGGTACPRKSFERSMGVLYFSRV